VFGEELFDPAVEVEAVLRPLEAVPFGRIDDVDDLALRARKAFTIESAWTIVTRGSFCP
jgi:hypothetical protein